MYLSTLWDTEPEPQVDLGPEWPRELPVLPLEGVVPFPRTAMSLSVDQRPAVRLLEDVLDGDGLFVLTAVRDSLAATPEPQDVYTVGAVAHVAQVLRSDESGYLVILRPLERARIETWVSEKPYLAARVALHPEKVGDPLEVDALRRELTAAAGRLADLLPDVPVALEEVLEEVTSPTEFVYLLASSFRCDVGPAQSILTAPNVTDQMRTLLGIIDHEVTVLEMGRSVRQEAMAEIEAAHHNELLRQQLEIIRRELGEEETDSEADVYLAVIESAGLPAEARAVAEQEVARLARLQPQSGEAGVIRTYLEWLTSLPWNELSQGDLNLDRAGQMLDADHHGLQDVKERILEYLAVRKLRCERGVGDEEDASATILCLVGPPGVGKTSLGRSVARALGREFARMSLGGLQDEAEIRGHRRTYVGAMPGRIVQALRQVGTRDPLFMLDEVDKVGQDWRGDPTSALLEVLDPVQNRAFRDHYVNVDFDLSQVFFICTANNASTIPAALLDRMEVIGIEGYTEMEKLSIAREYLVPRQVRSNGLMPEEVIFTDDGLSTIIRDYTREAGVRSLEREIARVLRKVAAHVAGGGRGLSLIVDARLVRECLGKPRFHDIGRLHAGLPGVATGLGWTPSGGDLLSVEARVMEDAGPLILTGQLGVALRESAYIALSYVKGEAERLGMPADDLRDRTVHFHVPAASVPKDGPSAGITLVTALASALRDEPVRDGVAMTGEVALRGQVLPIGGLRQKVLAAHRHGMKTVVIPRANEADLDDIPDCIRDEIDFVLVDHVDEVLDVALGPVAEFEVVV